MIYICGQPEYIFWTKYLCCTRIYKVIDDTWTSSYSKALYSLDDCMIEGSSEASNVNHHLAALRAPTPADACFFLAQ